VKAQLIEEVMAVYREFDERIEQIKMQFGINCPPGCGKCCASPNVEATVLEVMPLARWLHENSDWEQYLHVNNKNPHSGCCAFYTPHELQFGHGRCSVYPYRPTLCRLFAYASVRNKYGKVEFAACRFIRQIIPDAVIAVQNHVDAGNEVLMFTDAAAQMAGIDPSLNRRYPINVAVQQALLKIGMYEHLEALEAGEPHIDPFTTPPLENCS
jgi:uncharacterized protein